MSLYLEIPQLPVNFPFRVFINSGKVLVYPHWHKEVEFIYVLKGTVNIGVSDQLLRLEKNEVYFFDSGVPHYFLASPESERIVVQFDLKLFYEQSLRGQDKHTLAQLFAKAENHSRHWSKSTAQKVSSCIQCMYQEMSTAKPGYLYEVNACLHRLVALFYREVPSKCEQSHPEHLKGTPRSQDTLAILDQIFSYVEKHFQEAINLEDVAHYVGFSPHYLTRFFKKNTGTTFIAFLTEYRLNNAKYILANEHLPMIEVAEQSGFNSVKTFHHVFKKAVGVSPLKYQKMLADPSYNPEKNKQ